jgi:hypothetical protein
MGKEALAIIVFVVYLFWGLNMGAESEMEHISDSLIIALLFYIALNLSK